MVESKKYPLVFDTVDKSFFNSFLYLKPTSKNLKESQKYRRLERENMSRLMEMLLKRYSKKDSMLKLVYLNSNRDSRKIQHRYQITIWLLIEYAELQQ